MSPEREREIYLFEAASKLMRLLEEIDEQLYIVIEDDTLSLRANNPTYGKTIVIWGDE